MLIIRRMVGGFLARLGVRCNPTFGPLRVKRSAAVPAAAAVRHATPFSGEKRVALHEHSAAHSRGVSMYDGGGSWRGGDGGGAHQARKAKFVL